MWISSWSTHSLTHSQFVAQRNQHTANIVATWNVLKCKKHSEQDRQNYPGGHQGCNCQRDIATLHGNWSCRADTIDRQLPSIEEGDRRLNLALHTRGPQKRKPGRRKLRARSTARRHPIAICCMGRPWLNTPAARTAGGPVGHPQATKMCISCYGIVV